CCLAAAPTERLNCLADLRPTGSSIGPAVGGRYSVARRLWGSGLRVARLRRGVLRFVVFVGLRFRLFWFGDLFLFFILVSVVWSARGRSKRRLRVKQVLIGDVVPVENVTCVREEKCERLGLL